jgi:hypothetical protein
MTDSNTYNFQDYTQNQAIDYGTNQIQSNTEIDPSTYLQGDSAILQASAGLGETTTENVDYLNQNNFDTNAIFGETIKKISEIPYGQNFQGITTTTTSNIIDGNTLFGDNNALISNTTTQEVQGTTTDVNSFFNNTNFDTNAIYGQTQILPETTTTTTTNENTYFTQPQEIQGTTTYGETQILPSTDSNTYYGTTQINYEQPQTQNDYTTSYQTTNTIDLNNLNLNNYNFGTTNIESTNNTYTTEAIPITQNETTTTTTNTYIEPTSYDTAQNYGITNTQTYQASEIPITTTTTENAFETSNIPITETQYISTQPQYDNTQYQQSYDTTPITTNINTITNETTNNNIITQPNIETNYVPNSNSNQIMMQTQIENNNITNNVNNIDNNNQITRVTNPIQETRDTKPQIIPINLNKNKGPSAYKILGNLIDEDFKRGRPIYTEYGSPYMKKRHYDQLAPTYQVRRVMNESRNVIGLSRLTPAMSYDRVGNNPPTLNSTIGKLNTNSINLYNSNVNNMINNNIGLERITKANSYDTGAQSINPLLNNYGFNQNKI